MKSASLKFSISLLITILIAVFVQYSSCAQNNKIKSANWENNSLIIEASEKIQYTEARLKDPDRLVVDILDSFINENLKATNIKTNLEEQVSITDTQEGKTRIVFLGEASINRKVFLTNHEKTLIIKIARISSESTEEIISKELEKLQEEKADTGEIKELNIEEEPDKTEITISTNKSIKYNTYRLKNPDRIAIDLLNILPPSTTLPYPEKTTLISGIRIGSAASGIEATRIVIDLTNGNLDSDISSNLLGNKLKIKLLPKQEEEAKLKTSFKAVLDPGHGGYDTGASYGGFDEKDINLIVAEKLKKFLIEAGITVILTREDDSFISLAERTDITNSVMPDIFVSIHANALKSSVGIRGIETYYWTPQSQKLAYIAHNTILKLVQIPDHYIRKARFYVVKYTSVPAILVEMGFMTNSEDRKLLTSSTTQDKYAKAMGESILEFLGVKPEVAKEDSKS
ncbi:MAG: N-acetylmuramoyl-L-alanine amidase [Candidatus Melainabacteria bacterium]|nr:N-acetylmuramoyl-L-alanine amidase [Candidatus Melainabacteria bacterium]MBI3307870.1 N-acetylmuramoyl-L-alanine amidase [Candidatus Melainabacteria bacterium]